jgi:hypothetical protein
MQDLFVKVLREIRDEYGERPACNEIKQKINARMMCPHN